MRPPVDEEVSGLTFEPFALNLNCGVLSGENEGHGGGEVEA